MSDRYNRFVDRLGRYKGLMPGSCVCYGERGRAFGEWANCPHGWLGRLAEVEQERNELSAALTEHEAQEERSEPG